LRFTKTGDQRFFYIK
jgi:hypothetical protein